MKKLILTKISRVITIFIELGTGKYDPQKYADRLNTDNWSIKIEGECDKPGTFSFDDIIKPHTMEERIYRLRCVEGWSMVIPGLVLP